LAFVSFLRDWFEHTRPMRLVRRAQAWKARVDRAQTLAFERVAELEAALGRAAAERDALRAERDATQTVCERLDRVTGALVAESFGRVGRVLRFDAGTLLARRGDALRALRCPAGIAPPAPLGGLDVAQAAALLGSGAIASIETATLGEGGAISGWTQEPELTALARALPAEFGALLAASPPPPAFAGDLDPAALYAARGRALAVAPDLIDFLALAEPEPPAPFGQERLPPFRAPAEPVRRSVVFLNNCYYNYKYLAQALRARGWDAATVSLEPPGSPQQQFFHGEDINLHDPDPLRMRRAAADFFARAPERFGAVQFYGQGSCSFFPENYESGAPLRRTPWDFMELRRHRTLIGYTVSGCADAGLQSSIRRATGGVCARCVWENRPDICSDQRNGAWIAKLESFCDWIGLEGDWTTAPERATPRHVRRPVVMALDADLWRPDLDPPENFRIARAPGELLVYHAVGNYATRRVGDRDIKGTGAVFAAVETLKAEGLPARLVFAHEVPSRDVRFYQVQADVVVDQLNYGRIGANARETLMLGRPLVTALDPGRPALQSILEAPALHADEKSVVDVLRRALLDPELRARMGRAGRAYALRWHEAGACAARFETLLDRLRRGLPPEDDAMFPPPTPSGL
jgi:hypothetical protein